MGRIRLLYLLFVLFFLFSGTYSFGDQSTFRIDWRVREIVVTGIGYIIPRDTGNTMEWQHSATVNAKQHLLKSFIASMKDLRIDAYNYARDIMIKEPQRNEAVFGYMGNIGEFDVKYGEETVSLEKHIPFFGAGGVVNLLIESGNDPGNFPSYNEFVYSTGFTGLVIDGRGLRKIPAINPRIFDEEHNLVYSVDLLDVESFIQWGACQYTDDPHYRGFEERVGNNPLQIVAIHNEKLIETDLSISNENAKVLLQHEETRKSLQEGRVIVILDDI
ncbi:MAG: hypothetical protein JSV25_08165 [Spirochaetota bacterium]|nr:MAG: hypothetical protein JSV25_08165 [Spirochaetota bacterium]